MAKKNSGSEPKELSQAAPKRFRIRITAGEHAGKYVGEISGFPVRAARRRYFLDAEEGLAIQFFDFAAPGVQAELKKIGYKTELVEGK